MGDARTERILAEGLLCTGLSLDDPWSLEAALAYFDESVIGRSQDDFFVGVYRAAAITRRYPLSDELPALLARLSIDLETADIGAARNELQTWFADEIQAVSRRREQFLPQLRQSRDRFERGEELPTEELIALILLTAQTGPTGIDQALAILDTRPPSQIQPEIAAFYHAEVTRGLLDQRRTKRHYESTEKSLCRQPKIPPNSECILVRQRIDHLKFLNSPMKGESS